MQSEPSPSLSGRRETLAVWIVAGYSALAGIWCSIRVLDGAPWSIAPLAYAIVVGVAIWCVRGRTRMRTILRDWLPFIALPVLYGLVPATIGATEFKDAMVQGWDRAMFGGDVARTLAGRWPWAVVGGILHLAYLSYYAIIYLPPLLLYRWKSGSGFGLTVLSFTIAMVACFAIFLVFPVQGPRYAWPAPAGVPDEPVRQVVLFLLERGSSRGTAFPSSHVAIAAAISLSCLSAWRRLGLVTLTTTVLLAVGAVYGGFHYAVDMVVGAVVGIAAWLASRAVNA